MKREDFERMITPYLKLKTKDGRYVGVNSDKIEKVGDKALSWERKIRENGVLYYYYNTYNEGHYFIYSLKDKHYFFRNPKRAQKGVYVLPGWNNEIQKDANAIMTEEPRQFVERGFQVGDMNGGQGWAWDSSEIWILPTTFHTFLNWPNENPLELK